MAVNAFMIVSEPAIPDGIIIDITDAITATIAGQYFIDSKHSASSFAVRSPRDEDGVDDDD